MTQDNLTVAQKRKYRVQHAQAAKEISLLWLTQAELVNVIDFGLPEVDDRYHIWRVPLLNKFNQEKIGEIVIDAYTTLIIEEISPKIKQNRSSASYQLSDLRNTIAQGDSEKMLQELPTESVDLIFTSPPYYNARPEYADYLSYEEYLLKLRKIIHQAHRVLAEGRFFVMNIAPVLIRRASRSEASKRIAVPFDVHGLFIQEGFDFMEDIIWEKPSGAGWATGRGRRFAADRNPLQYKAVPVTEYILVYRKHTDKLIDWHIRSHPQPELVDESKIDDSYERTNIWRITPSHDKRHPAIFPLELAERVVQYYSFKQDVVLDPFAGIGTVGSAASKLGRRFVLIERNPDYVNIIRQEAKIWLGPEAKHVLTLNCAPISTEDTLL